ncbi:hypothetical protein HRW18_16100 [Streptomyces lunaelactis]|uniref:hypothetical protein n=1 Tax=Streptomyces lunaelactis TaxID=1535768 RepID=UPI0015847047|nr:hypothetical protein [Streptomyces lunaelactis]NUK09499.1 hypothetical protein [Streptomyces lunaelactis]NUK73376.1 hypothetical protein [Streptomyces lunaelactis]NUL10917.1 hypothetical protein [Streptomyces lunaelactis]NUL24509.1 hypothetical protein [Streptomyces lunaelactis]
MADIDTTSQIPEPELPRPAHEPAPSSDGGPARNRVLDLVALVALLGLCAGVYLAVGDAGFSVIITAVAGLFGAWRMRR